MRLKIGSTYQKAVTIIEKLKEGNASIFICGKTTLSSDIIIRNLLESGVRIVVIDHRHAVSLPADLEPYVHRQDVSQKPLKLHLFGTSANPADAAASFVDTVASVIRLSDGQKPLLLSLLEKVLRDSPAPNPEFPVTRCTRFGKSLDSFVGTEVFREWRFRDFLRHHLAGIRFVSAIHATHR